MAETTPRERYNDAARDEISEHNLKYEKLQQIQSDFSVVLVMNARGPAVLAEIGHILHYWEPALTDADRILQNAFRVILELCGGIDSDAEAQVRKLLGRQ